MHLTLSGIRSGCLTHLEQVLLANLRQDLHKTCLLRVAGMMGRKSDAVLELPMFFKMAD